MEILVFLFVAMMIIIICAAFTPDEKSEPPQIDYTEQNELCVIGYEFADPDDLRNLSPNELQEKLDASNPLSVELSKVKGALELLGPSPRSWRARKKKDVLEVLLYEMRLRHGALREQAVQPLATDAIRDAVDGLATQMQLGWHRRRQLGRGNRR